MAKIINLVESYVSGAGTSLFASFLLEFLLSNQFEPFLVDLDKSNPDVLSRYQSSCDCVTGIGLNPTDNKRTSELGYLLSAVYDRDRQAVVNVPSIGLDRIQEFVDDNSFEEIRLRRWFVSSLEPRSWDIFEKIANSSEDKFQLIVVHNLRSGLEMTEEQQEFCEVRGIKVLKISWIQFPGRDLQVIEDKPNLPLTKLPLSEQGQRRLQVHMERIFIQIFSIVVGAAVEKK